MSRVHVLSILATAVLTVGCAVETEGDEPVEDVHSMEAVDRDLETVEAPDEDRDAVAIAAKQVNLYVVSPETEKSRRANKVRFTLTRFDYSVRVRGRSLENAVHLTHGWVSIGCHNVNNGNSYSTLLRADYVWKDTTVPGNARAWNWFFRCEPWYRVTWVEAVMVEE